jgi:hypothetical protein
MDGTAPQPSPVVSKRALIAICGAIVLGLLLVTFGFFFRSRQAATPIGNGAAMTSAAKGTIVAGFPQDVILEKSAAVAASYRLDYAGGRSQPVVVYLSARSVGENLLAFREYFIVNGWDLLQPGDLRVAPVVVAAEKGGEQATITIQALGPAGARVTETILSS